MMTNAANILKEIEDDVMRWKIAMTVLHSIGISCTIFRFWFRQRIRKLWWDDYISIITFLTETTMLTTLWVTPMQKNSESIALYMLAVVSIVLLLWSTRICLALSIARIYPAGEKNRRLAFGLVILFSIVGLSIGSSNLTTCATYAIRWASNRHKPICVLNKGLIIAMFVGELTSDVLLFVFPLYALWHVKLPKNQRRLVLLVFSAGICTIMVIVSYIFIVFSPSARNIQGFVALSVMPHFQASISVIVCNSSVVITFIYRTFFNRPAYNTTLTSGSESTASLTRSSSGSSYDTESVNSQITTWSDGIMTQTATMAQDPSSYALTDISSASYSYPRTSDDSGNGVVDRGVQTVNSRVSVSVGAVV